MAKSILAHILGTRFFPSTGLVQEYSKKYELSFKKKLMKKFSNKSKKNYFWSIFDPFCQFLAQIFFEKSDSEKTNEQIPRKLPDRKTEGLKDGRTGFDPKDPPSQ